MVVDEVPRVEHAAQEEREREHAEHVVAVALRRRCAATTPARRRCPTPTISGRVSGMSHSGPMRVPWPGGGELGRRRDAERPEQLVRMEQRAGVGDRRRARRSRRAASAGRRERPCRSRRRRRSAGRRAARPARRAGSRAPPTAWRRRASDEERARPADAVGARDEHGADRARGRQQILRMSVDERGVRERAASAEDQEQRPRPDARRPAPGRRSRPRRAASPSSPGSAVRRKTIVSMPPSASVSSALGAPIATTNPL